MPTQAIWYPEGIQMIAGDVVQLTDCTPMYGYQDFDEKTASEWGPGFVGAIQATPEISFRTRQLQTIFSECDVEDVCAGLHEDAIPNPYTVRFFMRGGAPFGTRAADNVPASHHVVDLVNSAFLCWETLTVDQGSAAELQCRLNIAAQADIQSQDPFVWTGTVPDPMPLGPLVQHVFTMGPVVVPNLGGTGKVGGVTNIRWENRITREEQYSDGDPFPTYQGIREMMPMCTFTTTNVGLLDLMVGTDRRGVLVSGSGFDVYLRRMNRAEIHEADNATLHIRLRMERALLWARQVSNNPAEVEVSVRAYKTGFSQNLFTVLQGTTIP